MKAKFTLLICAIIILSSCGASRKTNCDAYGSIQQTQNSELASK
jgi:hypothetical protein